MFYGVLAQTDSLLDLVDVGARVFNIALMSAGAFFVVFVIFAAYKFASSQGDPKAYAGARQSLTYAVMGFLVVLGLAVLNKIVIDAIGINSSTDYGEINSVFDAIKAGISSVYDFAGVTGY